MSPDGGSNGTPRRLATAVPAEIEELVASCRDFVLRSVGHDLDGTGDTLPLLDHWVREARGGVAERPELEHLVVRAAGAYFGTVVSDLVDGFWYGPEGAEVGQLRVCSRRAYLAVSPFGVAHEVLAGSTEHSGPSAELAIAPEDRALVEPRLAALGPLAEDDYFRFSTRIEAIEVAFRALSEAMLEGGQGDVVFEPEDYEE